jgi:antitoxin (DNA-binding transcriptional repressor) of toxin-antitoxin stability system
MNTISVQEIQQNPLQFVHRVEEGESLLIVRDQQPLAEIKPLARIARQPRPFGLCAGMFICPDDFDAPLPDDVLKEFET